MEIYLLISLSSFMILANLLDLCWSQRSNNSSLPNLCHRDHTHDVMLKYKQSLQSFLGLTEQLLCGLCPWLSKSYQSYCLPWTPGSQVPASPVFLQLSLISQPQCFIHLDLRQVSLHLIEWRYDIRVWVIMLMTWQYFFMLLKSYSSSFIPMSSWISCSIW
jgi:hypothetical protein